MKPNLYFWGVKLMDRTGAAGEHYGVAESHNEMVELVKKDWPDLEIVGVTRGVRIEFQPAGSATDH